MKIQILLGEPIFRAELANALISPVGQLYLCQTIREETQDEQKIYNRLREEYLAIAHALHVRMRVDFRIVYSRPKEVDTQILEVLIKIGCRLIGFPPVLPRLAVFPRDFGIELPGICLLSPNFGQLVKDKVKDRKAIVSPYGEGGRILTKGDVVLVGDRICRTSYWDPPQIQPLEEAGLRVGVIPNFLIVEVSRENPSLGRFSTNDHLDRVACLITDTNGNLHLVVDPQIVAGPARNPTPTHQTVEKIRRICEPLGIKVNVPKKMLVPYSTGLWQFGDGRVLMTSGDEPVAEVVADIVGSDKLFLTEVPIKYYPAWALAGIHCLIGEAPLVFFRPTKEGEPIPGSAE